MPNPIFQSFSTKQELEEFLTSLTRMEQQLFTTQINPQELIEKELPFTTSQAFRSYCKNQQVSFADQKSFHQIVQTLTHDAQQLPVLSLRLSFMPSKPLIDMIVQWVHSHLSLSHLVDISVDPSLIGGAIVSYQGKYEDNSLKKTVEAFFANMNKQATDEHSV